MPVLLVLLLACLATSARADSRPIGIPPALAEQLIERVQMVGADYRFDGGSKDASVLQLHWSKQGEPCPPARLTIRNYWSPLRVARLDVAIPAETLVRCPGLRAAIDSIGALTGQPLGRPLLFPLLVVSGLVVTFALFVRHALAPGPFRMPDLGWLGLLLAIAAPFFFDISGAAKLELGLAWPLFTVLLLDRHLLAIERGTERVAMIILAVMAFLLHWMLASGGPGDLRLNLSPIWSTELDLRLGPAPIALFQLLGWVRGHIVDTHIIWCNLILSVLLPPILYAVAANLGVNRRAAWLAALIAAAHPLLIAYSGVLERQPAYLFAASGSLLALIGFLERGGLRQFTAFVLGTVLATMTRPEGAHVLILHLAALVTLPAQRAPRRAAALALAAMALLSFAYIETVLGGGSGGRSFAGWFPILWTIPFSGDFTPRAWILAWLLGMALGYRRRPAWMVLGMLVGLDIVWRYVGVYNMFVGTDRQVASARYETIILIPFTIGMALAFQALLDARGWLRASLGIAFVVVTALTIGPAYQTLIPPFTVDHEYRLLRKYAHTLPSTARVHVFDSPIDDIGLIDAHLVGQFTGSAVRFHNWSQRQCDDLIGDPAETYVYLGSSCAELVDGQAAIQSPEYTRWLRDCSAMRDRLGAPVDHVDVPARRMAFHDFKNPTVHLALYHLRDASLCGIGPRCRLPPEPGKPCEAMPQ